MIARPCQCDPSKIEQLVRDTLPESEHQTLAEQLSTCPACRERLEQIEAQESWLADTRDALDSRNYAEETSGFSLSGLAAEGLRKVSGDGNINAPGSVDAPNVLVQQQWLQSMLEPANTAEDSFGSRPLGQLDGLEVRSVIGQGGMGVVARGYDAALQRDVAIKLLSPMLAGCGAARGRFFREAQAAAAIVHPNIVPIFSISDGSATSTIHEPQVVAGTATRGSKRDCVPYITMPLITGGNLQQLLDQHGPLPIDRVLSIGHQVAEGLAAAHEQGIVHRDIKPANLMLDGGGFRVMITDFGLARALDDSTLTGSGMLAGTPQYMSPEQAQGQSIDHRSDLYSLGAVLYALATGRPPATGDSTMQIVHQIGKTKPKPVTEINEAYPKWFERLLDMLLQPERSNRLGSADEAATLLRKALAHARSPHRVELPRELQPTLSSTTKLQLAATASLIAAVIAAAAFTWGVHWGETQKTQQSSDTSQTTLSTGVGQTGADDFLNSPDGAWQPQELEGSLSIVELQLQQLTSEISQD
ncbi:MAG TPA: serine/threonine protein kinase [Planctomycetaceae bacterium]|nr:serine/threonine protein kinase [Planctomycetaceae bacterium]